MNYLSIPVFEWKIDWGDGSNGRWDFDLREFQLGFGPVLTDIQQDHIIHGFEFQTEFRDDDIIDFDAFVDALKGRANPFWLPGPSLAFKIASTVEEILSSSSSSSSTTPRPAVITVLEQGLETSWELHPGGYLWFSKEGEDSQIAKISSIADNGNGTEAVTLEEEPDVPVDDSWKVFPIYLVRFADDVERVEIVAERWQRRSFRVVELPKDYALLDDGLEALDEPIILYNFRAIFPTGEVSWKYTSHPEDVVLEGTGLQSSSSSSSSESNLSSSSSSKSDQSSLSSVRSSQSSINSSSSTAVSLTSSSSSSSSEDSSTSQSSDNSSSSSGPTSTWVAVGIENTRITRSVRLGGTVTITADYDSVEPLRLLAPLRLAVPLRVQILETNLRLQEARIVFDGECMRPQLEGRKISVTCSEWGSALDQTFPGHLIQIPCNYQVFSEGKCKKDPTNFHYLINVIGKAGRTVTVEPTGGESKSLVGKPINYFALGRVEIGTGLTRRAYFIMSATAAFGNRVTLTFASTFDEEVPASGTMRPGCDGKRSTCREKYDNEPQFGGNSTPRDNLAITAIKTTPKGGKK